GEERSFIAFAPPGARLVRQRGEGLAARLRNFFEDSFGKGGGPVVVVGSDAPTLPLDRVEAAFAALAAGRGAAICPDEGGGYCLIGLVRSLPALFDGVEMGTPRVAQETRDRAAQAGIDLAVLEPWHDVDTPEDLARLAAELRDPTVAAPRTRAALRDLGARTASLDMKGDWDRRAREDARYYIATTNSTSEEEFAASGERDVAHFFDGLEGLLRPDAVVLDIGCGVGRMDAFIAPRVGRLIGLDVSGEMVARARERLARLGNVAFVEGDGSSLAPIPDASVDLVFSHIVFQHGPRSVLVGYLPEVRRVLRAGGDFVFQVPDGLGRAGPDPPDADTFNLRFYTEEEVRRRIEAAGLRWVECRRFRVGRVDQP
ncbi:MAG TPA: DUF2064 domain-containing protein, partial [Planctomycetota bacterium]|nr:DUF2064 domain-containing protein [Planctomycetota bacterium]